MSSRAVAPPAAELARGVQSGDRRAVAKAITLLESRRAADFEQGLDLLELLVSHSGGGLRVGVSGPPGVGKSSWIEALGLHLIEQDHRVAVLAVDPSSPVTGGSILGDKTRMARLSQDERAFIRPTPSGGTLGGVAHRTREATLVCEAAGYDVVLIETVGVGQSETEVASMVDFFALLLQPGAGDELQGIKKGVVELADALLVNKADGDQARAAERARADYTSALHLLRPRSASWSPPVICTSALEGTGIPEFWGAVLKHREALQSSGEFEARRLKQARAWLWALLEQGLGEAFRQDPRVSAKLPGMLERVESRTQAPPRAARELLRSFLDARGD